MYSQLYIQRALCQVGYTFTAAPVPAPRYSTVFHPTLFLVIDHSLSDIKIVSST